MKSALIDPIMYLGTITAPFPISALHVIAGATLVVYTVGHSFRLAFIDQRKFSQVRLLGRMAFDACLSMLFLVASTSAFAFFHLLSPTTLISTFCLAVGGSLSIASVKQIRNEMKWPSKLTTLSVACIAVFGLSVAIVFRRYFGWPSMPGWDVYAHLADVNWIVKQGGLTTLFPSSSRTLLPYPYLFEALVASLSQLLGVPSYTIFWYGPYFSIPMYGLLTFALSSVLTRNFPQSIFAAWVAASISGGEILLGPQYFFPSTAFILFFMLCLVGLSESPLHGIWQGLFGVTTFGSCFLLYYYPLFLSLPPIILILVNRNPASFLRRWNLILLGLTFTATILFTYAGSLLLSVSSLVLELKLFVLGAAYPDVLWLFIAMGFAIVGVKVFKQDRERFLIPLLIVCYVTLMIVLFLLPLSGSDRSELLLRPFASIVASYSVIALVKVATLRGLDWRKAIRIPRPGWRVLQAGALVFLGFSAFLLVQPYIQYGQSVTRWSNISSDEYQAAYWLSLNSPSGSYILTDPSSGFLFRGLTLLNSSTSFIVDGEALAPNASSPLLSTIYDLFTTTNASQISSYLDKLPQVPSFVVITTRTASWASWGGIKSRFLAPTINMPDSFAGYEKFSSNLFQPVIMWQTVQIFSPTGILLQQARNDQS